MRGRTGPRSRPATRQCGSTANPRVAHVQASCSTGRPDPPGRRTRTPVHHSGERAMRFVVCGLSITSSWGNGHATTYRALLRELAARGHDILFLERNVPWYADNRDLAKPPY